jgi:hypothetical protein
MQISGDARIRGAFIKDQRDWLRTAYGSDAYKAALSKLSPAHRAVVHGTIRAEDLYPVQAWDSFQVHMRAEAQKRQGLGNHDFAMRCMREAGLTIVRPAVRLLLALRSPERVVEKSVARCNRMYDQGHCEVVVNEGGRAVLRYCDCPPILRTSLRNGFLASLLFALELAGARALEGRVSRDDLVDGKLVFEIEVRYAA